LEHTQYLVAEHFATNLSFSGTVRKATLEIIVQFHMREFAFVTILKKVIMKERNVHVYQEHSQQQQTINTTHQKYAPDISFWPFGANKYK
jgi:hypothetical protein